MPSSASYTESQTGSQSSRGPHITQWLPQLVLTALFSLAVASIIGVSLSAVAFSNAEELGKPGHGIAQCFVLFASMISLFYLPLHLLASRKGESLYLSPPLPSFRHLLHAWSILIIRVTVALWSSATITVAVGIYRGGGGSNTVRLNVNMFSCATGLLFSALVLTVIQFARRPFTLPWISPPLFDADVPADDGGFDKFGEATAAPSTAGSTTTETSSARSTDGSSTLRGSPSTPTVHRSKASSPSSSPSPSPPSSSASSAKVLSSGTTSRSTSPTRSRPRKRALTKRYIIERPAPTTPELKRRDSGGSTGGSASVDTGAASSSEGRSRDGSKLEDELVPGAETSESYFEAAPSSPSSSSASTSASSAGQSVQGGGSGKGKGKENAGPVTPEGRSGGYRMNHRGVAAGGSPSVFRFGRKAVVKTGPGGKHQDGSAGGGQKKGGQGAGAPTEQSVPPPPASPPPPPVPTYSVPGAWVTHGNPGEVGVEA